MANYFQAVNKSLVKEGAMNSKLGYNNTSGDKGGETVAGIARNFWGQLDLWLIVDSLKSHPKFPYVLKTNALLIQKIMTFYKKEFWDKIGGDGIKSQNIAELILDSAINEGISPAIKRAENICGLKITGKFSENLIKKLNSL